MQFLLDAREVKEYALLVPQFVDLKAEDGTVLHGVLLLPTEGAAVVNGKVPLINNPYGGPGVQTIWDAWHTVDLFDQYMAKRGYAILKVDNRGMSDRGEKFAAAMAHHMCELPLAGSTGSRTAGAEAVSATRSRSPGLVGLELWRNDDGVGTGTLRSVQSGRERRAGDRLAQLRLDLHRALHGPAEGSC